MKLKCKKSELQDAVSKVSHAVSPKSTIAAIEGILMKATRTDGIYMCGYNLELGITCNIPAGVTEEGGVVLPAKMLSDIARRLPSEEVSIECGQNLVVVIKSGNASYELSGIKAEEFPELPDFVATSFFEIEQDTLRSMIRQTRHAISENMMHPIYTGAKFEVRGDIFRLIALDGQRIACRTEKISSSSELDFVVPGKTLAEAEKLFGESDESVKISVSKHHVNFSFGVYDMISRVLEGNFMDYRSVVKVKTVIDANINARRMIEGTERMALMLPNSYTTPVRCFFGDGSIRMVCKSDLGAANDEWDEDIEQKTVEIWFKNQYILEALRASECDRVHLRTGGEEDPMVITPLEGDSFEFCLMPVRQVGK